MAILLLASAAACSSTPDAPPTGKREGESCGVSTECAAGLFCATGVCTSGLCRSAEDCEGEPPAGCGRWACVGGQCSGGCFDGGFLDADLTPDADPVDAADAGRLRRDSGPRDVAPGEDATDIADAGPRPDTGPRPDLGCGQSARAPHPGDLVINEIHADPADMLDGDANRDGARDSSDDEFVEIVNSSTSPIDLTGVALGDMTATIRHTFGSLLLGCAQAIVVFGGGDTGDIMWRPNWVVASSGGLSLNNSNEQVRLGSSVANIGDLATESYTTGAADQSLVREVDGIPGAQLMPHTQHPSSGGARFSPGVRVDGTPF